MAVMYVVASMVGNQLGDNKGIEARKIAIIGILFISSITIVVDIFLFNFQLKMRINLFKDEDVLDLIS